MIFVFNPHWIVVGISILIGIFAYKKDKNPILFGGLNYAIAMGIVSLVVFVNPLFRLWFFQIGMSESSLYSFAGFTAGGGLFGYLNNVNTYDDEYEEDEDIDNNEKEEGETKGT